MDSIGNQARIDGSGSDSAAPTMPGSRWVKRAHGIEQVRDNNDAPACMAASDAVAQSASLWPRLIWIPASLRHADLGVRVTDSGATVTSKLANGLALQRANGLHVPIGLRLPDKGSVMRAAACLRQMRPSKCRPRQPGTPRLQRISLLHQCLDWFALAYQ